MYYRGAAAAILAFDITYEVSICTYRIFISLFFCWLSVAPRARPIVQRILLFIKCRFLKLFLHCNVLFAFIHLQFSIFLFSELIPKSWQVDRRIERYRY